MVLPQGPRSLLGEDVGEGITCDLAPRRRWRPNGGARLPCSCCLEYLVQVVDQWPLGGRDSVETSFSVEASQLRIAPLATLHHAKSRGFCLYTV